MGVDVNRLIDEGRWTVLQKVLIAATALTIVLDGIDNQLLATAIPTLMTEWTLKRGDFSTALSMSPLGMLLGGALGGWLGDRIGRRTALLTSVLVFALPTALIYFANNVTELSVFRFLAGLGLGGAMPSATALASEYVPRRQRPFAVTLTIVCVPVGATIAAFLSARVIPLYGWRLFFLGGGILPLLLGIMLFFILPESPRFLAGRPRLWPKLIALLNRIGHPVPADTTFFDSGAAQATKTRGSIFALFAPALRRDTFGLVGAFFCCLLVVYLALQLLVTALVSAGYREDAARDALGWWNIGGVAGAIMGALIIQRLGSKATMMALCAIAGITAFTVASMPLGSHAAPATTTGALTAATGPETQAGTFSLTSSKGITLILICFVMGGTINAIQVALYALAAHVYPTEIRGTGLGVTVAVGRIGNVLAAKVGNFALDKGGTSAYFQVFGVGMFLVLCALAVVRRHIERTSRTVVPAQIETAVRE